MRLTAPKRPGTPHALSGRAVHTNLDAGTLDKLAWLGNVYKRLIKHEAGKSVLLRRAVAFYLAHIEHLLQSDPDELRAETYRLRDAARGDTEALPEDELLAKQPKLFSAIKRAASEARMKAGRESVRELLSQPLRLPNDDPAGEAE